MHISSKRKKEILTCIEDCCLFAEVLQWTLYLSFPWPFFLCPYGSVLPHTESRIFPHHCFSTLTCLPLLYLASLLPPTLRWGRENTCLTASPTEERLKIQVGFDWWCNYPGVQNFQPFAVATLEKFTRFRHYPPPELACELALAGSLLHSSYVEC